jgi:hypothetical protein
MCRLCLVLFAVCLAVCLAGVESRAATTNAGQERSSNAGAPATPKRARTARPYTVVLEFKRPYPENADAFIAATGLRLYGRIRGGSLSTELTRKQLREILGLTFTVSVVEGAGNREDTDAYFATIRNPGALKPEFKLLLRRVSINTDPKREVGEGDPEYKPSATAPRPPAQGI